jgi:ribosomal protein S18 acetylase RimI-like enzyme
MISILPATSLHDLQAVRDLLLAYAQSRGFDAALGDFQTELSQLPGKYAPPGGCLLLAKSDGIACGCIAFQALAAGICEMKRLYVKPDQRGRGIARALCAELIRQAEAAAYQIMRLDTHPSMLAAQGLYQQLGFVEISRYNANPTPGIRFFEKQLHDQG